MDFDKASGSWDDERRTRRAKIIAEEILSTVRPATGSSALEFGCGTGLVSFNLRDCFKHITLVDTSRGMIEVLNSRIRASNTDNMTALCADIGKDEMLKEKFDVIYSSMALHHVDDIHQTLKTLIGLLNDKGCLCIADLVEDDGRFHMNEPGFKGHNGFRPGMLAGLFESMGLTGVVYRVFYTDTKTVNDAIIEYSLFLIAGMKP